MKVNKIDMTFTPEREQPNKNKKAKTFTELLLEELNGESEPKETK